MTVGSRTRRKFELEGRLQGVGFRPFVHRLARAHDLTGRVLNTPHGVRLEVQGEPAHVSRFEESLRSDLPPHARIRRAHSESLPVLDGESDFVILPSEPGAGRMVAEVLPDLAICKECAREIRDPSNRRYRYPFTHCVHCGPRYSILERLPYDRGRTTLRGFRMCKACQSEFDDPADRRFHAQPNCCPVCGPSLALQDRSGLLLARREQALEGAIEAIRGGRIVAVLGVGGFHLVCDAADDAALARLREGKGRRSRPFAVMFPTLDSVREACELSSAEEEVLSGPGAPITLLRRKSFSRPDAAISELVAPGIASLGAFLPYTPLHQLLLEGVGRPVVATSGNVSDEPICHRADEASSRLGGLADLFLVHDRPIAHPVDDSVVRVIAGKETVLRAGRGYAPFRVEIPAESRDSDAETCIAVGAHQKNSVALWSGDTLVMGPHVGDLDTAEALDAHQRAISSLAGIHGLDSGPVARVTDLHPDYGSSRLAEGLALERHPARIQHHHAHVLSCMAEHGLRGPVLGVAWDGTGFGTDGTIWGGEFLRVGVRGFERVASLRSFILPGGDSAVREPWRVAVALMHEAGNSAGLPAFETTERELAVVRTMLARGIHSPWTTSAGRLFDGVAALLGLHPRVDHEGQAAVALEDLAESAAGAKAGSAEGYAMPFADGRLDWAPMLESLLADRAAGVPAEVIAWRFHAALAEGIVAVAAVARNACEGRVVLSGGCFQNRLLTGLAEARLLAAGFEVYRHHRVPPNDGGIALGQLWARVIGRDLNRGGP